MKENQLELSLEFKKYCPDIEFRPICKHIQWYIRFTCLFMDIEVVKARYKNNPRACTYFYDHSKRKILYKITENIYKSDVGWNQLKAGKKKLSVILQECLLVIAGVSWKVLYVKNLLTHCTLILNK